MTTLWLGRMRDGELERRHTRHLYPTLLAIVDDDLKLMLTNSFASSIRTRLGFKPSIDIGEHR